LGLTGLALRFLSNYSATRRYIADASYWIYLVHLPLIAALQVWVGSWPLHWGAKFPFIVVVGFGILFLSYHYLVRPSFIGQLLNGRKIRRQKPSSTPTPGGSSPAPQSPPPAANGDAPVARLSGIVKRFGAVTALSGIDIEVRRGELLAVLGPNGAGKSTAIALWLGLIEADAGEVTLLGGAPQDVERRRRLGVMMQDVELVKELRVRELVALAASYYADPMTVEQALRVTGIDALAGRLYGKLSGGQKRQVQLAICGRPRLLFLDEPTVGLDIRAREALWSNIRTLLAEGCSVVLTTHYLEEAEALATRVAVLAQGRLIASGSVDDMRALVARRRITCESALTPEDVRGWTGVIDAARDRGRLVITATDAEDVVRRLLAADPALKRLEVREAGLSEAFSELTKEAA
jgi:ABC-type multidrug transport system ATPase subunit